MNKSFSYFIRLRFTKFFSNFNNKIEFFSLIINYLFHLLISLESKELSIFIKAHTQVRQLESFGSILTRTEMKTQHSQGRDERWTSK